MSFCTDRDLLAIEPAVFQDVPFVAQERLKVEDAVLSGTVLTSAGADFVAAGVGPGSVVLINAVAHEVLDRLDVGSIEVSLPRSRATDDAIPSGDGTAMQVIARTFGPQSDLVHAGLLRLIGIEPDDPGAEVGEASIVSVGLLARIEALGTLEIIYAGAASLTGDNDVLLMKAGEYRRRFRQACAGATILLDTDLDGVVDRRVSLGTAYLSRA